MKTERFVEKWGKSRKDGRTIYLLKFSAATLVGILVGDFLIFIFAQISQFIVINSFILFTAMVISLFFNWDRNEKKYHDLLNIQSTKRNTE